MKKETVKIVIIGHIDHGKSTLIGRLLLETKSLPKEKISDIRKISKELGKDIELAYITDQLKEERAQNITIDTTQTFFKTPRRNFVIIDTPGHIGFLKNMITGASLAQIAILIIDITEGVKEQTRRHAYIINMLGIDRVIVVLNKIDLVNYEEARYNAVKKEVLEFLKGIRIKASFIIPVSAKEGINILKKPSMISWYKGPSLLRAFDSVDLSKKIAKKPLRFPVQDVYDINGERIAVGRVVSGVIKQDQKILLLPSLKKSTIRAIRVFNGRIRKAQEGENVGLVLDKSLSIKRGDVIISQKEKNPEPTNRFKGDIFWMNDEPLQINKTISLQCATQCVKCKAEKIEKRINPSTLEIIEKDAKALKLNEAGVVVFKIEKPIVVENFSFIEELGKFIIEDECKLTGAGIIVENKIDK